MMENKTRTQHEFNPLNSEMPRATISDEETELAEFCTEDGPWYQQYKRRLQHEAIA